MRISDWRSDVCSSDLPVVRSPADQPASGCQHQRRRCEALAGTRQTGARADERRKGDPAPARRLRCTRGAGQRNELAHRTAPTEKLPDSGTSRSEAHTSELQSIMRITYTAFLLNKNKTSTNIN